MFSHFLFNKECMINMRKGKIIGIEDLIDFLPVSRFNEGERGGNGVSYFGATSRARRKSKPL